MSYLTHRSKLPQLMAQFQKRGLLKHRGEEISSPKWIVVNTTITDPTARKALAPETADMVRIDVLWEIFLSLLTARFVVTSKGTERLVTWDDVVEIVEVED